MALARMLGYGSDNSLRQCEEGSRVRPCQAMTLS